MSPAQSSAPRNTVANSGVRTPWKLSTFFVSDLSPANNKPAGLEPVYRKPRRFNSAATFDSSALLPPNDSARLNTRSGVVVLNALTTGSTSPSTGNDSTM